MSDSPIILCLETSSSRCSVALVVGNKRFHQISDTIQNHAEVLMGMIQEVCDKASIELSKIDAIAISDGPGSYTGLRIGSSTAKGICFALDIPLISISTLKAMASEVFKTHSVEYVWPMIDARRMEVYHGIFDSSLRLVQAITNGIVTDEGFVPVWIENQSIVICGDGAKKASEVLGLKAIDIYPDAAYLCGLAIEAYNNKEFTDLASYEPFYLKSANITTSKKA